jgi:hypothetical protein
MYDDEPFMIGDDESGSDDGTLAESLHHTDHLPVLAVGTPVPARVLT